MTTSDYAWKNIDHWWSNLHRNPDGSTTSWIPKMKKIWFTEFGFPSVDGSSNQPNVFYDPKSSEGGLPYLSQGVRSNQAQRIGISATLKKWASSPMIERMFLWTWDARPYPYYPNRNNIWGDGALWPMGHFVGGKLGQNLLGDVINDLCKRSGIHQEYVNSISLDQAVTGITLINKPKSVREILRELATGYFFHIVENGDGLSFFSNPDPARSRWQKSAATIIRYDDLIDANVSRNSLIDRSALQIIYTDYNNEYKVSNCYAGAVNGGNMLKLTMPMTLDQDSAITIAKRIFSNIISGRDLIEMTLPETFYRNNIRIGNLVRLDWIDRRCFIIQSAIIDSSNRIKIVVQSIG